MAVLVVRKIDQNFCEEKLKILLKETPVKILKKKKVTHKISLTGPETVPDEGKANLIRTQFGGMLTNPL